MSEQSLSEFINYFEDNTKEKSIEDWKGFLGAIGNYFNKVNLGDILEEYIDLKKAKEQQNFLADRIYKIFCHWDNRKKFPIPIKEEENFLKIFQRATIDIGALLTAIKLSGFEPETIVTKLGDVSTKITSLDAKIKELEGKNKEKPNSNAKPINPISLFPLTILLLDSVN